MMDKFLKIIGAMLLSGIAVFCCIMIPISIMQGRMVLAIANMITTGIHWFLYACLLYDIARER